MTSDATATAKRRGQIAGNELLQGARMAYIIKEWVFIVNSETENFTEAEFSIGTPVNDAG